MAGPLLRDALRALAHDFDQVAVPQDGRYVKNPTSVGRGTAYDPVEE
jgi:hypothetical protein